MDIKRIIEKNDIIAVDCDEVLCDSTRYLLNKFQLQKSNWETLLLEDLENYVYANSPWVLQSDEEFVEMFIQIYEEDSKSLQIPPIEWAIEGIRKLQLLWTKLYVVTARQDFLKEYTI